MHQPLAIHKLQWMKKKEKQEPRKKKKGGREIAIQMKSSLEDSERKIKMNIFNMTIFLIRYMN